MFLILGCCFALIFNYCSNPNETIPEPEPKPDPVIEVSAYALPESISYASSTTIYWKTKNVTSVTLNGNPVSVNGPKDILDLKKDTMIILRFVGYNGQIITKSVQITVAEPIVVFPTAIDTFSSRYWMFIVTHSFFDGKWNDFYFDEDIRTRRWFFYKNKTYEKIKKDGSIVENGVYDIKKDTLILNNGDGKFKFKIFLSDTTMILQLCNLDSTSVGTYKGLMIQ